MSIKQNLPFLERGKNKFWEEKEGKKKKKKNEVNSLSSKSVNRFLVNFHTKNAMTPMAATPPATDSPIIDPVPKPELELPLVVLPLVDGAADVLDALSGKVCVSVCVPPALEGVDVNPLVMEGALDAVVGPVLGAVVDCWFAVVCWAAVVLG